METPKEQQTKKAIPIAKKNSNIAFPVMTWGIRNHFQSIGVLVTLLVLATIYLTGNNNLRSSHDSPATHKNAGDSPSQCNLFSGKWVFDNSSHPLYSGKQCTYMSDEVACEKFGRKDLSYQNWRWQPHQCDLPRFNATALLEILRGKRLVYVGDSLNRGQWVSMVCLVESSIPRSQKSMHSNGSLNTFKAIEYNATIEFYWSPLLLESNSDHPYNHRVADRIVRIKAIEKHARYWTDADILVFNSYLWWRRPTMKLLWGSFDRSDGIYKEVEILRSYKMALQTWSDWLDMHVNRNKTQLFFVSMSPTHSRKSEWSNERGGNCYNETKMITKEGYWGEGSDPKMMRLVEAAIEELGKRGLTVKMLNITQMSEYRKEAHPSIYRKQWDLLTQRQISNPSSYADCNHWCLPGVPDNWNELLYTLLLPSSSS
ncbi:protein trichome birefringence-like 34 [Macadamia integrifolia]|uniref:protein trichome birefringence-like 34 n=1 Tax=Macadamia integrifolia TaxID=60698 RepID=UPI001C4E51AE|nr:protein trichome birefringence-like 34 [Macadamia integrifolia]XP_042510811.1 protein trichome birefringence-like 34 [Macadamia integrifolia]XP_042510812.1 protein trichome birefringence-like 34 [Macadamia integrifolia]